MAQKLELPALGQSMEEGTITRWFKAEGESVQKGETLYEVMTDKVNIEVESPVAGTLRKILAEVDAFVPVGDPVAILGEPGEDISALLGASAGEEALTPQPPLPQAGEGEQEKPPRPAPRYGGPATRGNSGEPELLNHTPPELGAGGPLNPYPANGHVFASPRARRYADEYGVDIALLSGRGTGVDQRVVEADVVAFYEEQQAAKRGQRVSPLAQRVAGEHGVPVSSIAGTGHGGKVTQDDVRRLLEPAPAEPMSAAPAIAPAAPAPAQPGTVIKLTGMRKMIADAVARSASTAPHVTLTLGVDMTEATRFRAQVLPAIEKTLGVRVSFTDIVAKATVRALADHPLLNSTLAGTEITLHNSVHLGIAVSLGTEGLIVPVVKDAQAKSLGEFSKSLKTLAAKAKAGTLGTDEVSGGTFSITNLGTYGITQFNPIINPPQCAILGVCTITDTVVPIGGVAEVRPIMNLCLSFDHRITDGAPAAAFLARLREILEQPYLMFA